jgi:hypothetical protein
VLVSWRTVTVDSSAIYSHWYGMRPREVRAAVRASRRIHGWFSADAAALFGLIDQAQKEHAITGDLFEIGAHHGKSTVMLGHMAAGPETVGVCDIFGSQALNASTSGHGDRGVFEANMDRCAPERPYRIFEKPSTELTAQEIGTGFRFFHVDGGHLAEEALADLRLAGRVIDPYGVIVVDDPFRPEWPGVTEAVTDFCREGDFEPVVIGFNKLVLALPDARHVYDQALDAWQWDYFDRGVYSRKELPVLGARAAIYFTPTTRQLPRRLERPLVRLANAFSS